MTDKSYVELPLYEKIYFTVGQIPRGKVATYGQIARIVGGCSAQMIGFALAALPEGRDKDVPWQRVINRMGKISPHGFGFGTAMQRQLLEEEGIAFSIDNTIDLNEYGWEVAFLI